MIHLRLRPKKIEPLDKKELLTPKITQKTEAALGMLQHPRWSAL